MAKEQWKKAGVIGSLIALGLMVVGLAWAGGGRLVSVEKDIENHASNQAEDRSTIKEIVAIVTKLKEMNDKEHKALRKDSSEAELRDARMATQYTSILSHMTQQTKHTEASDSSIKRIEVDLGKIQTKVDTLIKD